jgi:hypothetical protein
VIATTSLESILNASLTTILANSSYKALLTLENSVALLGLKGWHLPNTAATAIEKKDLQETGRSSDSLDAVETYGIILHPIAVETSAAQPSLFPVVRLSIPLRYHG